MSDVTFECPAETVSEVCSEPVQNGTTCTRCGLETNLPLTGTKSFCQSCLRTGDAHQDGDSCSELNWL
jgi:hypothetical protein